MFGTTTQDPIHLAFDKAKAQTGLCVIYDQAPDESTHLVIVGASQPLEISFDPNRVDEAHILYMEATEILHSRAKVGESAAAIEAVLRQLISQYEGSPKATPSRQDTAPKELPLSSDLRPPTSHIFTPNPGKSITIDVEGVTYQRLPIKTRLITEADTDLLPLVEQYVSPHLEDGDVVYVSEKALTITQGRVIDFHDIHPSGLARLLGRNIQNNYGTENFKGFGHGTALAMQLFIEEAGYPRVLLAALVAAVTRPFGIRGMFYRLCGKRAKSVDCPLSFLLL